MFRECVLILVFGTGIFITESCTSIQCGTSKDQFFEQFDRFIAEVEEQDLTVADSRWNIYDKNFETYLLDCYVKFREDLSFNERQQVIYQAVQYYFYRYKADMIRELDRDDREVSVLVRSEMREIWEEPEALFKELTGEDWEKLVDDFIRDLNKWEQSIRSIFDGDETE